MSGSRADRTWSSSIRGVVAVIIAPSGSAALVFGPGLICTMRSPGSDCQSIRAVVPSRSGACLSSTVTFTSALPSRTSSPSTRPTLNPSIWTRLPPKRLVAWGNTNVAW